VYRLVLNRGFPVGEKHRSPGQAKASFASLGAARGQLSRKKSAEQIVLPAVALEIEAEIPGWLASDCFGLGDG